MNDNNGAGPRHGAGTVMMRLMYDDTCIGAGLDLTEWELNLLNGIRKLCREGIDRSDVAKEGPLRPSIQAVWQMCPSDGDLQDPGDRKIVDGMDAIWATKFEQSLLDDLRSMALEALGVPR